MRLCWCFRAFKRHVNAVFFRFHAHGFGVQHDVVKAVLIHFLPHFDQVAVRALHQAVHHFHHIQACAQSAVNRAHFKANDATADDQHFFWHAFKLQRTRRINDAWIFRDERQFGHAAARGNDGIFKRHGFFAARFF